ncbi:MAG: peptidoglycan-binding protein [Clostridiales bacterium]|nr:peptidoglycan-binding protein [Clostridiales bacterium]
MKRIVCLLVALLLSLTLCTAVAAAADATVPAELPEDLGGKTLYGYLMDLKSNYLPTKVFQDAARYTEQDRSNARAAAALVISATTDQMNAAGKPDQYMLYLRAYARDLLFQDAGDAVTRQEALADYRQTVELGGAYAQADFDRLAALEVPAAPLQWQVPQLLTLAEMGEILGHSAQDLTLVNTPYQTSDGSRLGAGYRLQGAEQPAEATIFILADPQGGKDRTDVLKSFAFLSDPKTLDGIGDEAMLLPLRNMGVQPQRYWAVVARKDQLVLQVWVPDAAWGSPAGDAGAADIAQAVAGKVLANLYDSGRAFPDAAGEVITPCDLAIALDPGTPDSPVPDSMPADLGGKTEYGYLVDLRQRYLPAQVFTDPKHTDAERNDARRAVRLIVENLNRRMDLYGQNPYELEIRAACYAQAYADTGDVRFWRLAVNDGKQAMRKGYIPAKAGYDALVTPYLAPMAGIRTGDEGKYVAALQTWLAQAGYLTGPAAQRFDDETGLAVKAFQAANSLTSDGVVDLAFLLALYAQVDDAGNGLPAY